jgi:hypothetical protein
MGVIHFQEANMNTKNSLRRRIKILLVFFVSALAVSGLTAIPLQWELKIIMSLFGDGTVLSSMFPALTNWLGRINEGVQNGYGQYPFLAYGTDWLAFGHIAIAVAFLGVFRDPVKNIWVVEFGMLACLLIIPWALIFGAIRHIPFFWQMIDMSFGIFGIIPLWFIRRDIIMISVEG